MTAPPRLLFLFCDGIGLRQAGAGDDPWALAHLPSWERLLGAKPHAELRVERPQLSFRPLDATLGLPRLPQSGTGLVSLLTGHNASAWLGRHHAGVPTGGLAELLARDGWPRQLAERGGRVTVLNAYTPSYFPDGPRRRGMSAITQAGVAAGVGFRMLAELSAGQAVPFDLSGEAFAARGWPGPPRDPAHHGRRAAELAAEWDLSLFEFALSDWTGHRAHLAAAVATLESYDAFLGGVMEARSEGLAVTLISDHGNLEAPSSQLHTRNPVPFLWVGPGAQAARSGTGILDVPQLVRRHFSLPPPQALPEGPPPALPRPRPSTSLS